MPRCSLQFEKEFRVKEVGRKLGAPATADEVAAKKKKERIAIVEQNRARNLSAFVLFV
jgi:hypothetical protein